MKVIEKVEKIFRISERFAGLYAFCCSHDRDGDPGSVQESLRCPGPHRGGFWLNAGTLATEPRMVEALMDDLRAVEGDDTLIWSYQMGTRHPAVSSRKIHEGSTGYPNAGTDCRELAMADHDLQNSSVDSGDQLRSTDRQAR